MTTRFATLAATAALAAVATPALAQSGAGGRTIAFREVEKGSTFKFVDQAPRTTVGKHGPGRFSPGDALVFTTPLADTRGRIGRLRALCTATRSSRRFEKAAFLCTGAIILRYGTLFVDVANVGGSVTRGAVVGGTGAYAGARGTFVSREGKTGSKDVVTLLP